MIEALAPEKNLLGLWDAKNLGYFASAVFPGADFRNPGEPRLNAGKKESGRQLHLLEAVCVANRLTANKYQAFERDLLRMALEKELRIPFGPMLKYYAAEKPMCAARVAAARRGEVRHLLFLSKDSPQAKLAQFRLSPIYPQFTLPIYPSAPNKRFCFQ